VAFVVYAIEHKVSRSIVIGVLDAASLLLLLGSALAFLLVFSGIASWIDYRREECDLLDEAVREGFRQRPSLRNAWRWPEIYVLIFVTIASGAIWWALQKIAAAILP
jgi:hypothetical protein